MSEHQRRRDALATESADVTVDVDTTEGLRAVPARFARHWKGWALVAVLALIAWALYGIGGWTVDTAAFAAATLLLGVYELWALTQDVE